MSSRSICADWRLGPTVLAADSGLKVTVVSNPISSSARRSPMERRRTASQVRSLSALQQTVFAAFAAIAFAIEEIRWLFALVNYGSQTCTEVKATTHRQPTNVHAKIAGLQRVERVLTRTAVECSGDVVPDCPTIDARAL